MAKNDFWDLTYRPYTQLKLKILKEYLDVWASIFFNTIFSVLLREDSIFKQQRKQLSPGINF